MKLSIVLPTRQRAKYLKHAILTCLDNAGDHFEVLVLDNASGDDTAAAVEEIVDPRLRLVRSDRRLSMRDNFERGLDIAQGDTIIFLGDDDGILPGAIDRALALFTGDVAAVSNTRAHYSWPDLLTSRRGTGLLPRSQSWHLLNSRDGMRTLLDHEDYYRLPCVYHGFVQRRLIEKVRLRQGRFFCSSQVDIYSAIALSMEGVSYIHCDFPLVINGGSARSNGASHFSGGSDTERTLWRAEDDLGFLSGFANYATVGSLIVESGLRYAAANSIDFANIFPESSVAAALNYDFEQRGISGRDQSSAFGAAKLAGVTLNTTLPKRRLAASVDRLRHLVRSFANMRAIDFEHRGISTVSGAAKVMGDLIARNQLGMASGIGEQLRASARIAGLSLR